MHGVSSSSRARHRGVRRICTASRSSHTTLQRVRIVILVLADSLLRLSNPDCRSAVLSALLTAVHCTMTNDRGKTALVSIVLVSFTVGVATGWLMNSFARKVRCRSFCLP